MKVFTYSVASHAAKSLLSRALDDRTVEILAGSDASAQIGAFALKWLLVSCIGVSVANAVRRPNTPKLSLSDGLIVDISGLAFQAAMTMAID